MSGFSVKLKTLVRVNNSIVSLQTKDVLRNKGFIHIPFLCTIFLIQIFKYIKCFNISIIYFLANLLF